jgi:Na+/H+ antiporter NhaD/arsenite permease-like protein
VIENCWRAWLIAVGSLLAIFYVFHSVNFPKQGFSINSNEDVASFIQQSNEFLVAISLAAVFFGAGTYIGNGPNFMVRNIAEQVGVRTPTFVGYLVRYTLPVLVPVLALVSLLFFSSWRIF